MIGESPKGAASVREKDEGSLESDEEEEDEGIREDGVIDPNKLM